MTLFVEHFVVVVMVVDVGVNVGPIDSRSVVLMKV